MSQICEALQAHLAAMALAVGSPLSSLTSEKKSQELAQELQQGCQCRVSYTSGAGRLPPSWGHGH